MVVISVLRRIVLATYVDDCMAGGEEGGVTGTKEG